MAPRARRRAPRRAAEATVSERERCASQLADGCPARGWARAAGADTLPAETPRGRPVGERARGARAAGAAASAPPACPTPARS